MALRRRVGLSYDFRSDEAVTSWGDIGLEELTAAGVDWEFLPPDGGELEPSAIDGYDAVIFAGPAVSARSVSGANPPIVLARFGVGLDEVDVAACTAAGVAVTVTPDGARRPVAAAALALILAASSHLVAKDRMVRDGRWAERGAVLGRGLTGRRVGVFGLGNVAAELFALLAPFGTENLATDPVRTAEEAAAVGARLVELPELMSSSDVLVITAALTESTRGAIDARALDLLPPGAVLVNVARGPIVDTAALVDALATGRVGAAGLDVTDPEPLPAGHPLLALPNVVLAPHSLAWTDEMALGNGRSAIRSVLAALAGRRPDHLVNRAVLDHERWRPLAGAAS